MRKWSDNCEQKKIKLNRNLKSTASLDYYYYYILFTEKKKKKMAHKLHEFSVTLVRDGPQMPWGIRLVGGSDLDTPLIITKVISKIRFKLYLFYDRDSWSIILIDPKKIGVGYNTTIDLASKQIKSSVLHCMSKMLMLILISISIFRFQFILNLMCS